MLRGENRGGRVTDRAAWQFPNLDCQEVCMMLSEKQAVTALRMMSKRPYTIDEHAPLSEAAELMLSQNIGCLPVVSADGPLVGLLTERMFQAAMAGIPRPFSVRNLQEKTIVRIWGGYNDSPTARVDAVTKLQNERVRDVMLADPPSVTEEATMTDVAEAFFANHLSHLPVVRDGIVVGVVARHDLLRTIAGG
ncbi:MAG: CBS domain-containing protein [Chloroflexi bacterium]|nr:CBS domain-containing protein [Chloroflexota bacterium]